MGKAGQSQLDAEQLGELAKHILADPKFACGLTLAALRTKVKRAKPQLLTAERLSSVLVQRPDVFRHGCVDDERQVYVWSLYPRFRIHLSTERLRELLNEATGKTVDLTEHAKFL